MEVKQKSLYKIQGEAAVEKMSAEQALRLMDPDALQYQIKQESVSNNVARMFDNFLILMNENVDNKFSNKSNATKSEDSWLTHLQLALSKPKLFHNIICFDKDAMTDEQCELLQAYFEKQEDFTRTTVI